MTEANPRESLTYRLRGWDSRVGGESLHQLFDSEADAIAAGDEALRLSGRSGDFEVSAAWVDELVIADDLLELVDDEDLRLVERRRR